MAQYRLENYTKYRLAPGEWAHVSCNGVRRACRRPNTARVWCQIDMRYDVQYG